MKITDETKTEMLRLVSGILYTDPRDKESEAKQHESLDGLRNMLEVMDERNKHRRTMAKARTDSTVWIAPLNVGYHAVDSTGASIPDTQRVTAHRVATAVDAMRRPGGHLEHIRAVAFISKASEPLPASEPKPLSKLPPSRPARRMRAGKPDSE